MKTEVENPMVLSVYRQTLVDDYHNDLFDTELDNVKCCICGEELYVEEADESEIWEDTFLCGEKGCDHIHYTGWRERVKIDKKKSRLGTEKR